MPSTWGKRHGLPGYDEFRLGLDYKGCYDLLKTSKKHRYRRKGSVLGHLHELKLQLYEEAVKRGYLETLDGAKPKPKRVRRAKGKKRA